MARGDPVFVRWDLNMFLDPRLRSLPNGTARWFYFSCYCAAVEGRSEVLHKKFTIRSMADRAKIDIRSAKIACKYACELDLLEMTADGRIRVPGVRQNHPKLAWDGTGEDSPCGADMGLEEKRREEKRREEKRETPLYPPKGGVSIPPPQEGNPLTLSADAPPGVRKRPPSVSAAQKKRLKVQANTSLMTRINPWFRRRPETLWTLQEAEALQELGLNSGNHTEEIELMEWFYTAEIEADNDDRRHALVTMLNNWSTELDKAARWKVKRGKPAPWTDSGMKDE